MSRERLIVIGGDAAGMSAASQARRRRKDIEILVLERSPHTSYGACGIPYYVGGLITESESLVARAPEVFREKMNIDARILHEAVEIDLDGRRVRVRNLQDGTETWEGFDQLLISTGASPIVPEVPGVDASGIYTIGTLQSGIDCREAVDREKPSRAVIVGGGYIGVEMAEALLMRGAKVAMVEMAPQVMGTLDSEPAEIVMKKMRADGVELFLEEALIGFETDSNGKAVAVVTSARSVSKQIQMARQSPSSPALALCRPTSSYSLSASAPSPSWRRNAACLSVTESR